jgi:hypothetical protein
VNAQKTERTYIEDVKDPDKILLPSRNLVFIALREDEPDYCTPFTMLRDLPLDPRQGSAIQTLVNGLLGVRSASLI